MIAQDQVINRQDRPQYQPQQQNQDQRQHQQQPQQSNQQNQNPQGPNQQSQNYQYPGVSANIEFTGQQQPEPFKLSPEIISILVGIAIFSFIMFLLLFFSKKLDL